MAKKPTDTEFPPEAAEADEAVGNALATRSREPYEMGKIKTVGPTNLQLPRLQLVYGVGDLAAKFTPGDVVLDKEAVIARKGEVFLCTILSVVEYFKEYCTNEQFQAGHTPQTFGSADEVLQNGGTLDWVEGQPPPTYSKAADIRMLIRQPEGTVCPAFSVKLQGSMFAPAIWSVDKKAYQGTVPGILYAANVALRDRGLVSGEFGIVTTISKNRKGNTVIQPKTTLKTHHPDEFVAELKKLFGIA